MITIDYKRREGVIIAKILITLYVDEPNIHGTTRPPLRGGKAPPPFNSQRGGPKAPPPLFTMIFQIFY